MTEHPGEQFPPEVDPDVEPGFDPYRSEEPESRPDYDTEPGPQDAGHGTAHEPAEHVDRAEVEFGPEFARAPGQEHEHSFEAGSAEDPSTPAEPTPAAEPAREAEPTAAAEPAHEAEPAAEAGPAGEAGPTGDAGLTGEAGAGDERESGGGARDEGGHPLVEETMGRLDGLRDRPVSEHAEVYADLHERLQTALVEADADQSDRG